jgi:hypothetical protein
MPHTSVTRKKKTGPKPRTIEEARSEALSRLRSYAKSHGLRTLDDWYHVSLSKVYSLLSSTVQTAFGGDTQAAIQALFPKETVYPFKFPMSPMGLWTDPANRTAYILWLAKELKLQTQTDWYNATRKQIRDNYGSGLLQSFTLLELLQETYPDKKWRPWLFISAPQGFWRDPTNQRLFLEWVLTQEKLAITKHNLSQLRSSALRKYKGAASAFKVYANFPQAIRSLFPEFTFTPLDFQHKGRGYWKEHNNQQDFLWSLGKSLGFSRLEDWYAITERDFELHGGISLLSYHSNSPTETVVHLLPEFSFDINKFARTSKYEARLYGIVKCLFFDYEVMLRVRHPDLRFSSTNRKMELDIYIPDLRLALEYQGGQHYHVAWGGAKELRAIQSRDNEKRIACDTAEITLVEVPFDQWDGTVVNAIYIINDKYPVNDLATKVFYHRLFETGILHEIEKEQKERTKRAKKSKAQRLRYSLTIDSVLSACDLFHKTHKTWPRRTSGKITGITGRTWAQINSSLIRGSYGLPGNSSLAQLLLEKRSVQHHLAKPKLTEHLILRWADLHRKRTGQWPTHKSGPVKESPNDTWLGIRKALVNGNRGLQGDSSIEKLLWEKRNVKGQHAGNQLTTELIMDYAKQHYELTNDYPHSSSQWALKAIKDSWQAIDVALRNGQRSLNALDGGLSKLLELNKLKRHRGSAPTKAQILEAAIEYQTSHPKGKWPTRVSGNVTELLDITWSAINDALKRGAITDTPERSLAQFLERVVDRRNQANLANLTETTILNWCDEYFSAHGKYPGQGSEALESMDSETFNNINAALTSGHRGLPGGSSLAKLLRKNRNYQDNYSRPKLTLPKIIDMMVDHYQTFAKWPVSTDKEVVGHASEKWSAINAALHIGSRGLRTSGNSLAKLRPRAIRRAKRLGLL